METSLSLEFRSYDDIMFGEMMKRLALKRKGGKAKSGFPIRSGSILNAF